jgi:transitional endoplasmic reticulum ATPase
MPLALDFEFQKLATATEGYTGAELAAICREAGLIAMEEYMKLMETPSNASGSAKRQVELRHFERAMKSIKPRLSPDVVRFYENFAAKAGLQQV